MKVENWTDVTEEKIFSRIGVSRRRHKWKKDKYEEAHLSLSYDRLNKALMTDDEKKIFLQIPSRSIQTCQDDHPLCLTMKLDWPNVFRGPIIVNFEAII